MSILPGLIMGFMGEGVGGLRNLVFIAGGGEDGNIPDETQAGDLLIVHEFTMKAAGTRTPSGYTKIYQGPTNDFSVGGYGARLEIFAKIAAGTEGDNTFPDDPNTVDIGSGGGEGGGGGPVYVDISTARFVSLFRPDGGLASFDATTYGTQQQRTNGNPSAQTQVLAGGAYPIMVLAMFASTGTPDRSWSPAKDSDRLFDVGDIFIQRAYFGWKFMKVTDLADVTVDTGDNGSGNTLYSAYMRFNYP